MIALDELQTDAFGELVNIAISGSAGALRGMVGAEVTLTVPAVSVVPPAQAAQTMRALGLTSLTAIRQTFSGDLSGETALVFPQENAAEFVALVLAELAPEEAEALVEDTLKEVGNVVLTGFLSRIGQLLRHTFDVGLPVLSRGQPEDLFSDGRQQIVLFIYVNFGVRGRSLRGYFAIILGLPSVAGFTQMLDRFIVQMTGMSLEERLLIKAGSAQPAA